MSLQSLFVQRKRYRIQMCWFALSLCVFVGLRQWVRERRVREGERERDLMRMGGSRSQCVSKGARSRMIRGWQPNTFISPLHGDRSRDAPHRRIRNAVDRREIIYSSWVYGWSGGDCGQRDGFGLRFVCVRYRGHHCGPELFPYSTTERKFNCHFSSLSARCMRSGGKRGKGDGLRDWMHT